VRYRLLHTSISSITRLAMLGCLQELNLGGNQIGGGDGMKAFSSALSSGALASLQRLFLSRNLIGDEGMKAFSSALSSGALASLIYLGLGSNRIGDAFVTGVRQKVPLHRAIAAPNDKPEWLRPFWNMYPYIVITVVRTLRIGLNSVWC
jgi:hypothetical protein